MVPPPTPVWNGAITNNSPHPAIGQPPYVSQPEFR
jgi:hypothetical protein